MAEVVGVGVVLLICVMLGFILGWMAGKSSRPPKEGRIEWTVGPIINQQQKGKR